MKTVGLFIDISNIYYNVGKRFAKQKLDYSKYLTKAVDGDVLLRAFAYGLETSDNQADRFVKYLRFLQIEPKYKRHTTYVNNQTGKTATRWSTWDVGISLDIVRVIDKLDVVVLGSNDPNLIPLIEYVKERGVKFVVFACGVGKEVREAADMYIEIDASLLETKNELPAESVQPSVTDQPAPVSATDRT